MNEFPQRYIPLDDWVQVHESEERASDSSEPRDISDVIVEDIEDWANAMHPDGRRWPRDRIGARAEIIWPIRFAVALRDNFTCRVCHSAPFPDIEMDHIIPWSAGGSDRSDNLRVLCKDCNQRRSNRIDGTEARGARPVTWWCQWCWVESDNQPVRWRQPWKTGHDLNVGRLVRKPIVTAFCAECRCLSRTDLTL